MADINELTDIDYFFYYGKNDVETEIEHDLVLGLLQPKRSAFYFRQYGAGVTEYEGQPNGLSLQVSIKFDIMDFIAKRNGRVSDGSQNRPDRRVSSSQSVIRVEPNKNGNLDISLYYLPLIRVENVRQLSFSSGGFNG